MGKYIHKYDKQYKFNDAYNGVSYIEPWVSLLDQEGGVAQIICGATVGVSDYAGTGKSDMNNNVYLWAEQGSDRVVATFDRNPTTSSTAFLMPHEIDTVHITNTYIDEPIHRITYNKVQDDDDLQEK